MRRTIVSIACALALLGACNAGRDDYHPVVQQGPSADDIEVCDRADAVMRMLERDDTEIDEMISIANAFSYAAENADDAELAQATQRVAYVNETFIYGSDTEAAAMSGDEENLAAFSTMVDICDRIGSPIRLLQEEDPT